MRPRRGSTGGSRRSRPSWRRCRGPRRRCSATRSARSSGSTTRASRPARPAVGFRPIPEPRSAARETRFVCSTDDPWCPPERSQALADSVGAPVDWLVRAGHVNADAGFGPWPALEAWCLGARPSPVSGA
ncbi:MAG TPA: alpha/beta hydrolase [Gaiellaceae bacterium]|nr:alpha/beta hydrolase [Gaiellaceae bacterium]